MAQVTAVAQIQSLAWEFPNAVGAAKNKQTKQKSNQKSGGKGGDFFLSQVPTPGGKINQSTLIPEAV